ncbi:hypothetical protein LEP1GSC046_1410 [Leptospira kirschneri serovar Bim str. 1051]|nr:hypothetical protein LEP1GSC042_2862 [Leptospira kirschneri serovar Bim str. PUO 1247]EMN03783.1 hypothetical protein LEP1GSC046_1410 [Leptospira kirschneri serovar Bim str. 1051]
MKINIYTKTKCRNSYKSEFCRSISKIVETPPSFFTEIVQVI